MDIISHTSLQKLVFETKSVEFREKNSTTRFDDFDDYGRAILISDDVKITFLWRTKAVEEMNTESAIYHIEIDQSVPIAAEINRDIIGRNGKKLDKTTASIYLTTLINAHLGWLIAVDDMLSQPRLNLVSSLSSQANNPYPNLVRF
jgi:hypothetical protein